MAKTKAKVKVKPVKVGSTNKGGNGLFPAKKVIAITSKIKNKQ